MSKLENIINKFPKKIKKLNKKQKLISDTFTQIWHEELRSRKKYNLIESFNHNFSAKSKFTEKIKKIKTLELGAGIGAQLKYENLQNQEYYCIELRSNMIEELRKLNKKVKIIKGDVQKKTNFKDNFFDRINVIHVLEHLPKLPDCINEVHRILKPSGIFQVVLPCDPGFLYSLGRRLSAKKIFEQKFKQNYDWFIKREHINSADEIIQLLKEKFYIVEEKYFPFFIKIIDANLCVGLTLKKNE